jgi:hypothetical protein
MSPRTVAVGLSADPGHGQVDLVLLPGETAPGPRPGLDVHSPADLSAALHTLRHVFADHAEILTLAQTAVVGTANPAWTDAIETRLSRFVEDLGNSVYDCWEGARNVLRNGDRFAGAPTSEQFRGALAGMPAICVAAGPSATPEALARIRGLRSTHVIFSAEVMLGACHRAGFAPDFVSIIERPPGTTAFVRGLGADSTLIASAVVDPATVREFPRVIWWRGGDRFYDWLFPDGSEPLTIGRSTGVLSIAAAVHAGCNPIYLVGHDLSYGSGHTSHCALSHPEAAGSLARAEANAPDCYGREPDTALGWDGQTVQTNGFWQLFRQDIETILADTPGRTVISAQDRQGAAIAGVVPGELPAVRIRAPMLVRPTIPGSDLPNIADRLPSVISDAEKLGSAALCAKARLEESDADLTDIAESLAISRVVSPANVPLFQYIAQTLNHALALRLAVRPETHRSCLRLLSRTMLALGAMIQKDLAA